MPTHVSYFSSLKNMTATHFFAAKLFFWSFFLQQEEQKQQEQWDSENHFKFLFSFFIFLRLLVFYSKKIILLPSHT
jgi:hypothetical protein